MTETNHSTTATDPQRAERCRKLAHDLKNCLAVIESGLDVLQLDPSQRSGHQFDEIHAMIVKERKAATRVTDDLLHAALETGES